MLFDGDAPWPTDGLERFAAQRAEQLPRGKGQPLPPRFDVALQMCLAWRLWQEGRVDAALAAVGRATEIVPGDTRVILFEEQARTNSAGSDERADGGVKREAVRICTTTALVSGALRSCSCRR